ncbi:hypothetical protein AB0L05_28920 [Nonomuraea pusilla]|uniref:hypothetical protein n=1 Tax=Nonomuraea pusilla TaxID=46177 RepID=UPI00331D89BE
MVGKVPVSGIPAEPPGQGRAAAGRQADSHGDEHAAIRILENGLARHAGAPPAQRLPALVHLAELRLRTGDPATAAALPLPPEERRALTQDLATAADLTTSLPDQP